MCKSASKLDDKDFCCNIIPTTLKPTARVEYIKKGGKNLREQDEILDMLEEVTEGIEAELELKNLQKQRCSHNQNGDSKRTPQNNDDKDGNWCRIQNKKHLWKNCPNNPKSRTY